MAHGRAFRDSEVRWSDRIVDVIQVGGTLTAVAITYAHPIMLIPLSAVLLGTLLLAASGPANSYFEAAPF